MGGFDFRDFQGRGSSDFGNFSDILILLEEEQQDRVKGLVLIKELI
jgi:hypothetical protein